ncbi:MAG: sigma-70 family RNA polymerase sigma factor, partial [Actinomycetota bacterium]|nr:sigma-70 family RNA polymerase sigma factor [Actinomycetota bacterium]
MSDEEVPSWEEIARTHGRFLYNLAYRLTGNDDDAQDLVQEVLLRVRKGLASYRPGSMEGWLSRIATNAFLDDVRRRKRRPVEFLPEEPDR